MTEQLADLHRKRRHEAPEVGGMVTRMLRALARRAAEGDVEALEQLALLQSTVTEQLGAGVAGFRDRGNSWGDVALVLGVSRQGAQQRFGSATIDPAHGPRCVCGLPNCPRTMQEQINALTAIGWTEDSAYDHVNKMCDRQLCSGPHEDEGEL